MPTLRWLLLAVVVALPPAIVEAQTPKLAQVPFCISELHRSQLVSRRDSLEQRKASLAQRDAELNSQCKGVEVGSAKASNCYAIRSELSADIGSYAESARRFNAEVETAKSECQDSKLPDGPPVVSTPSTTSVAPRVEEPRPVAKAGSVRGGVYSLADDGRKPVIQGSDIRFDTRLVTESDGRVDVNFDDGSQLVIGPNSEIVIDGFMYTQATLVHQPDGRAMAGLFRWISGKIHDYKNPRPRFRIPPAVLAVRGTEFEVEQKSEGSGVIRQISGSIELTPDKGGAPIMLQAGETVSYTADGKISKPAPIPANIRNGKLQ